MKKQNLINFYKYLIENGSLIAEATEASYMTRMIDNFIAKHYASVQVEDFEPTRIK